jgi:dienelactone hydrolase
MHPAAGQWKETPDRERWPEMRKRILEGAMKIAGAFPSEKAPLDPKVISEEDCGTYIRRKVSIQVQPEDRMPAWMLIPKKRPGRLPVVICMYGTTQGAGKDSTVGLSGYKRGTPPNPNWSFALDMVEAGFVAWAPDYLRDGERVKPGQRPYDTSDFHSRFPDWTIMGKDVWDNMRAIDYFETLDFIDSKRIGVVGHSYGAGNTINTAALEPRVTAAVANGPLSHFRYYRRSGRRSVPIHYYELESLIAPRALLVGQAAGEQRPLEEENYAAVREVYRALGHPDRVRFHWYAGDHDFPPEARKAAVEWFGRWFGTLR